MKTVALTLLIGCMVAAAPQQAPTQQQIDEAIKKGGDFLLQKYASGIPEDIWEYELLVYTLIHADVSPKKESVLKRGIDNLISASYPLKDAKSVSDNRLIYRMAVRALALHSLLLKVKRKKEYEGFKSKMNKMQEEIAECGQFLVDAQLDNGMWTYGGELTRKPVVKKGIIESGDRSESKHNEAASKEAWENASDLTGVLYRLKPKYGPDLDKETDVVTPLVPGSQRGDNSNSQYAILGLIAAQMSGCEVPRSTWELALNWFESCQWSDGGFGYQEGDGGGKTDADGRRGGVREHAKSGTMTTAGAVALAACYKYLGKDFKKEPKFQKALKWLGDHFSVTETPMAQSGTTPSVFVHYFLYGLERVGAFSGEAKFGAHDWYAEGATELLKNQKPDGSWLKNPFWGGKGETFAVNMDTCFAILFLKRATSEIIQTGTPMIEQK